MPIEVVVHPRMRGEFMRDLATHRKRARVNVGQTETRWTKITSSLYDYNDTFGTVLAPDYSNVRELLAELSGRVDRPVRVLDLFGYGHILSELKATGGVSVSLTDRRNGDEVLRQEELGIVNLNEDLTREKTWKMLSELDPSNPFFDLLLCHPIGATDSLSLHYDIVIQQVMWFLRQMKSLLHPAHGAILSQLPEFSQQYGRLYKRLDDLVEGEMNHGNTARLIPTTGYPAYSSFFYKKNGLR